jgi:hypothetical protein
MPLQPGRREEGNPAASAVERHDIAAAPLSDALRKNEKPVLAAIQTGVRSG